MPAALFVLPKAIVALASASLGLAKSSIDLHAKIRDLLPARKTRILEGFWARDTGTFVLFTKRNGLEDVNRLYESLERSRPLAVVLLKRVKNQVLVTGVLWGIAFAALLAAASMVVFEPILQFAMIGVAAMIGVVVYAPASFLRLARFHDQTSFVALIGVDTARLVREARDAARNIRTVLGSPLSAPEQQFLSEYIGVRSLTNALEATALKTSLEIARAPLFHMFKDRLQEVVADAITVLAREGRLRAVDQRDTLEAELSRLGLEDLVRLYPMNQDFWRFDYSRALQDGVKLDGV